MDQLHHLILSGNLNPVSHGANALKVDSEVTSEMINQTSAKEDINHVNDQYHQELLKNQMQKVL